MVVCYGELYNKKESRKNKVEGVVIMSKTCSFSKCQINEDFLIITVDNGEDLKAFCPNHMLMYMFEKSDLRKLMLSSYKSEVEKIGCCDACGKQGDVVYGTTNRDKRLQIALCEDDFERIVFRNLTPEGYLNIVEKFGMFHEIHDDFYTEDGYALQPNID